MDFPIALEAYDVTKQGDCLADRRVVLNEIEANSFVHEHPNQKIIIKPLTAEELGDPRIH